MGFIYKITSPSGRLYVGQTIKTSEKRWKEHIEDAINPGKNHCKALNEAIRKYKAENFIVEVLIECNDEELDKYEEMFINKLESKVPKGYNIKSGGSSSLHSEETKSKISKSMLGRIVSNDTKTKMMLSKKLNISLPMYVIEVRKDSEVIGYRVCNHPMGPEKRFLSKHQTLDVKLQRCKLYLDELNSLTEPKIVLKRQLPKFVQKHKKGYCVKFPNMKPKYFYSTTKTDSEKLDLAVCFLNQLTSKEKVQRLNVSG